MLAGDKISNPIEPFVFWAARLDRCLSDATAAFAFGELSWSFVCQLKVPSIESSFFAMPLTLHSTPVSESAEFQTNAALRLVSC